jgi:transposase-like protein
MQPVDIIKMSKSFIINRRHTPMKSGSQVLEQKLHRLVRNKVRSCSQPGIIWNIIESEMGAFLSDVLQKKLIEEQENLLQRKPYQRSADSRQRNGYKPLRLKGLFRAIRLKRPVLRGKTPVSPIIALFRSFGNGLVMLLASRFWLRGASTRAVAQELNRTMGTKLSSSEVSAFTQAILPDAQAWLERPITKSFAYLYVDALYLPVRKPGFTTDQALLTAVGMTEQGDRCVLGFLLGDRENVDSWSNLLKELLKRGLNRSAIKMVISDDHKAIASAVEQQLGVTHQRCIMHKMRNALVRVAAKQRAEFYADFKAAFWAETKEEAMRALGRLEAKWQKAYPKATSIACAKPEAFLHFMQQPKELWTTLRSTNLIERFNREIRRRLNPAGAMQGENQLWKLLWSISTEQEKRWAKRSIRKINKENIKLAA